MNTIYQNILKVLEHNQKKCSKFVNKTCTSTDGCLCRINADIWGNIFSVIPENYTHATIQDFTGFYNKNKVLDQKSLLLAREKIINYCWSGIEKGIDYSYEDWQPNSIIDQRLNNGTNIIIYGNPWSIDISASKDSFKKKKLGKTLVASIIMKEAIFQRHKPERMIDTYHWVNGILFCNRLMENAAKDSYAEEIAEMEETDWLVIDSLDYIKNNENGKQFRASVLDKFFSERLNCKKPTIIIFGEDISSNNNLEADFGVMVNSIVNSKNTCHIHLA